MSYQIPTIEPLSVTSGDTIKWKRSLGDYPSGTWTLKYTLVGPSNITITATADGTAHLVSVSKATSLTWIEGDYRMYGYVDDGSSRHQVYTGSISILPDPATVADGTETRSWYRRVRDHLRDIIEGKSQQSISQYTVAGRSISKMTWAELRDAYDWVSGRVAEEEAQDLANRGGTTGRTIGIRFNRP